MSQLLFSLRGVPDDEADEVRELLKEEGIDFYETPPGNWGISMPALWLINTDEQEKAQTVLNAYQERRYQEQHALYLELKQKGEHKTLFKSIKERPLLFLALLVMMGFIGYVSLKWLFDLGLALPKLKL